MSTINLLGALPVLLGPRFRSLDARGIRPFVQLLTLFNEHSSKHLRATSCLLWNHVVMAFCQARRDGNAWVFRREIKPTTERPLSGMSPISLLRVVFEHRRANWQPQQISPGRREKHRLSELALAYNLTGIVTGLLWTAFQKPEQVESTAAADARRESLLDRIFAEVVQTELPKVLKSPYEGSPALGWSLFAKIVSPRTSRDNEATIEQLVNPVLLETSTLPTAPALASTTTSPQVELLWQRALEASSQPRDALAFGEAWTFAHIEELLAFLRSCLTSIISGETALDKQLLEVSLRCRATHSSPR